MVRQICGIPAPCYASAPRNEMLAALLKRLGEDQSPHFVYFLTLYHLFREELGKRSDTRRGRPRGCPNPTSGITLHLFQQRRRFRRHQPPASAWGGSACWRTASGLGKTYTALAVMKYFSKRARPRPVPETAGMELEAFFVSRARQQPAGGRPLQLSCSRPHRPGPRTSRTWTGANTTSSS